MSPGSKWSTRYGAQYRRLCARPGCSAPAVATLRFQSTERLAWLVELDDNSVRTQGDLCSRHAAGLVLPRGWELHDERASRTVPPVPEPASRSVAAGSARRARGRRKPAERAAPEATQLPGLEPASRGEPAADVPAPAPAPPAVTTPVAETVAEGVAGSVAARDDEPEVRSSDADPVAPVSSGRGVPAQFGASEDIEVVDDELDEILDARTPLLRRAFRNAKPSD